MLAYAVFRWINRAGRGGSLGFSGSEPSQTEFFQENALFQNMLPNPLYAQP